MRLTRSLLVMSAAALLLALLPTRGSCATFHRDKAEQQACEACQDCSASSMTEPPAAATRTSIPIDKVRRRLHVPRRVQLMHVCSGRCCMGRPHDAHVTRCELGPAVTGTHEQSTLLLDAVVLWNEQVAQQARTGHGLLPIDPLLPLSAGEWPLLGSVVSTLLGLQNEVERAIAAAPSPVSLRCQVCRNCSDWHRNVHERRVPCFGRHPRCLSGAEEVPDLRTCDA